MPWEEKERKDMRKEFCERVLAHEKTKSALCREYGISRPTGDKWLKRYLAGEELRTGAAHRIPWRIDWIPQRRRVSSHTVKSIHR